MTASMVAPVLAKLVVFDPEPADFWDYPGCDTDDATQVGDFLEGMEAFEPPDLTETRPHNESWEWERAPGPLQGTIGREQPAAPPLPTARAAR